MLKKIHTWQVYAGLFSLLFLSSCASIPDPELYLLSVMPSQTLKTTQAKPIIALKPVELPKYLKSSRIVLRKSDNQLELAKNQRWAEPLADNVTRVLAGNLAQQLDLKQVYLYPSQAPQHVDLLVSVVVNHFIGSAQDGIDFDAYWQLYSPKTHTIVAKDTFIHHQNLAQTPANTAVLVAAMSQTIAALAAQIAPQIAP